MCCRPSPTATCTSRPGRWHGATCVSTGRRRWPKRSSASASARRHGTWVRGTGWRDAVWEAPPTAAALDAVTGDVPAALWAKDYHSLWLNSAALALAGEDLDVAGGVVERDTARQPNGVLREEAAWYFRDRFVTVTDDEWVEATREGLKVANARGVGAVHDKDGWLGAARIYARIHERDGLTLRVWQSFPHEHVGRLEEIGLRSRVGDDYLRLGYLKAFMDGTLGSRTAWLLDGSGVRITSGEELAEIVRAGARAGWPVAVHAIGDRANRDALDAFAATRRRVASRSGSGSGSSTRSAWPPRTSAASPSSASPARCSSRTRPRTATSPSASGPTATSTPTRTARWSTRARSSSNGSDAPVEELDPLAGIAAGVLRTIDDRAAWHPEQALTVEQALHASTVAPALARRRRAPSRQAPSRLPRRPRRPRPRPARCRARGAARPAGRRHHGRRTLGPQPAALGLTNTRGNHMVPPRAPSFAARHSHSASASRPAKPASGRRAAPPANGRSTTSNRDSRSTRRDWPERPLQFDS